MFFRILFTTLLLGSTIILQFIKNPSPLATPLLFLYGLIVGIFLLSFVYALMLCSGMRKILFAYLQVGIDTLIVTLIIFVTGGFSSIFSFLYLVVIIYTSMLLFRKGSMITAALCSMEYGTMISLEYYRILSPFGMEETFASATNGGSHFLYKALITTMACFAVAFLSSLLAEQAQRTKKALQAMEDHVKRVEKMAAVGEMGAGLAHEIKNPLASLAGCIQLLKEDIPYNPEHEKLMEIILREADRLNSLVSNFLLFARPPAGKVQPIHLSKALSETVELFEKNGSFSGKILIRKDFAFGIWVAMDPVHLHQIFWNLLINAAEATEGSGLIDFKIYPIKNKRVGIRITDSGCGMSRDILHSIFDPFFTTKPNGTGLGLSIVHRILESYGSRLDVDSEVNKGTTVAMEFKRIDPPTAAAA